jgi:AGCS family alanine or glycine:cation symporter
VELVWAWGDLMNGLQIFPNLVGVVGLSGLVARVLREDTAAARGEPAGGGRR